MMDRHMFGYRVSHRQIKAEVNDVLDKIKAEIIQMPTISQNANDIYKADVLQIINKHKVESEDKE